MAITLWPYTLVLHVMEEEADSHPYCLGELHCTLDSEDTAWIEPCSRLIVTEEIVDRLADHLRPLGVRWMRGWHDGAWKGRVVTSHGTRGVAGVDLLCDASAGSSGHRGGRVGEEDADPTLLP